MVLVLITDLLQSLVNSASAISVMAGCPNITGDAEFGSITNVSYPTAISTADGAFYGVLTDNAHVANVGINSVPGYNNLFNIDASHSSSIYGSSTTVTPLSLKTKFFIKY